MPPEGRAPRGSAEPGAVFAAQYNPTTGKSEWRPRPADYDYAAEIARSAYADMLHDGDRNLKFTGALTRIVSSLTKCDPCKPIHVVDIGTGSGILAMHAYKHTGAGKVTAVEVFEPAADIAQCVFERNGCGGIELLRLRSTELGEWRESERADVCVAEVFDTELIGEGAIATFKEAHRCLLKKGGRVVPSRARVYAMPVDSDHVADYRRIAPVHLRGAHVSIPPSVAECPGAAGVVHDMQLSTLPTDSFRPYCEPACVYDFDFERPDTLHCAGSRTVTLERKAGSSARKVDAVFFWWELDMDGSGDEEMRLSVAPSWCDQVGAAGYQWRDHWMQAVYYLPHSVPLPAGSLLRLRASHNEYNWWFDAAAVDTHCGVASAAAPPPPMPHCACDLHTAASRAALARLNDRPQLEAYVDELLRAAGASGAQRLLCISGDRTGAPLLALLACAALADSHLVQVLVDADARTLARANEFVRENRRVVADRLALTADRPPATFEPDAIVCEPVFAGGALPWHELRMWYELERLAPGRAEGSSVRLLPASGRLRCCAVSLSHLWKIRAPVGTVLGFDLAPFDKVVQDCIATADDAVEPHHLCEYDGRLVSPVADLAHFDFTRPPCRSESSHALRLERAGCNALALWMEYAVGAATLSRGLLPDDGDNGGSGTASLRWCRHARQGVYFLPERERLQCEGSEGGGSLSVQWTFDSDSGNGSVEVRLV